MSDADLVSTFLRPLNRAAVPYMVTGSVAATIYGEPRFTQDIDLVLRLSSADASRMADAFDDVSFYRPPLDVMVAEATRPAGGHFNLYHHASGWRADCYVQGIRELEAWGMEQRRLLELGEDVIAVAPPEYVILSKLEYYAQSHHGRHADDIRAMLHVSSASIQRDLIASWAARLGVAAEWLEIAATA